MRRRYKQKRKSREESNVNTEAEIRVIISKPSGTKFVSSHQKPGESWKEYILRAYRRNQPQQHFDSGLLTFRTERENSSVVSSHPVCGHLLQELEEIKTPVYNNNKKKTIFIFNMLLHRLNHLQQFMIDPLLFPCTLFPTVRP